VGPGAVGYASEEPQGEAVALEALGLLGPTAQPATGRIVPYLMRPLEDDRDERIVRAAAAALGKIHDPNTIPALMVALSDPRRAPFAAQALGEFGTEAELAAPVLVRLVEEAPDGERNSMIRRAIREIRGKQAYRSLSKNYSGMTAEIMRRINALVRQRNVKLRRMHIDGVHDELAPELASGETVHIEFDRAVWMERREVTGRVRVTREQTELSVAEYSGIEELEREFVRVLDATG
jgi:HEAT repeat protein